MLIMRIAVIIPLMHFVAIVKHQHHKLQIIML